MTEDELRQRMSKLQPKHWYILGLLEREPAALTKGGKMARVAWELQQLALAWPKRSPWWTITEHGRQALALRAEKTQ